VPGVKIADRPRVVLDEASFDFRGISDEQIERCLDDLNEGLRELRRQRPNGVIRAPMWESVECLDGCELYQFLCREHPSRVDRDTLLLTYSLLDKCPEWDDSSVGSIDTMVSIDGGAPVMALSVGYALAMARKGNGIACLVFPGAARREFLKVSGERGEAMVFFFCEPLALPEFWRSLFVLENVSEHEFFELAELAFPGLAFHPELSFGRFSGTYLTVRDRVVTILAGLNDNFAEEYARSGGLPRQLEVAMGRHHVDLSLESTKTRASERLMRLRDVTYGGRRFRCEWHAKLEPNRNRIHFSEPSEYLAGRILIGIFDDHLDT
jgi:hypothetical protein